MYNCLEEICPCWGSDDGHFVDYFIFSGVGATVFLCFGVILSFFAIKKPSFDQDRVYQIMSTFHKGCGIISLCLGSFCYMTGVTKQNFTTWLRQDIYGYFLAFICLFSTVVVLIDPAKVFIKKLMYVTFMNELVMSYIS